MSEKAPSQASSQEDLDQLSALEESMASFGMGDLDSEHGVILKDWSAQDFANIYVRFRPHLISHARKFLREETQAEEVVQDAFLYLMTALPELDSELGVLRFLKWKTKMLCLDIIRSSQAGLNNNLVPLPDDVADETHPLDSLERADDAAIIRLALAKLNPRHREALIATMYEEKSHEEVAKQMGVGENAFRQLLFRARTSFRSALVGEAEIEGKSISEILSIAARKEMGTAASKSLVLLLGVAVLGLTVQFTGIRGESLSEPHLAAPYSDSQYLLEGRLELRKTQSSAPGEFSPPDSSVLASTKGVGVEASDSLQTPGLGLLDSRDDSSTTAGAVNPNSESIFDEMSSHTELKAELASNLDKDFLEELAGRVSPSQSRTFYLEGELLTISAGEGITAYVGINHDSDLIVQHLSISLDSSLGQLIAVPSNAASVIEEGDGGTRILTYVATDILIGDLGGAFGNVTVEDAPIRNSALAIEITFDSSGTVSAADFSFIPRLEANA